MRELRVQAVDKLCSYLAYMLDNSDNGYMPKLTGRTYDLKSAYKQFGVILGMLTGSRSRSRGRLAALGSFQLWHCLLEPRNRSAACEFQLTSPL